MMMIKIVNRVNEGEYVKFEVMLKCYGENNKDAQKKIVYVKVLNEPLYALDIDVYAVSCLSDSVDEDTIQEIKEFVHCEVTNELMETFKSGVVTYFDKKQTISLSGGSIEWDKFSLDKGYVKSLVNRKMIHPDIVRQLIAVTKF